MVIYKIVNSKTSKVYIGKTHKSSMDRFNDHWYNAVVRGLSRPLYSDMRLQSREDFLVLDLHVLDDELEASSLEVVEIKNHIRELGRENVYNISVDIMDQCHTPEATVKAVTRAYRTSSERYGKDLSGSLNNPIAKKRSITNSLETRKSKYGSVAPMDIPEVRKGLLLEIHDSLTNDVLYGTREVHLRLVTEGYDLSKRVVQKLVLNKAFSKANTAKYPELVNRFSINRN